jgi:hypothetical protein
MTLHAIFRNAHIPTLGSEVLCHRGIMQTP